MLFEIIKELHINESNIEFSHDNSEIILKMVQELIQILFFSIQIDISIEGLRLFSL